MATDSLTKKEEAKEVAQTAAVAAAEASWPQTRAILRVILIVLAVAAVMWMLYALEGVILLIVLAIFFAYLIAPLVDFVQRPFNVRGRERVMPRPLAIGIVYLVLFGALTIGLWVLLPRIGTQITEFVQQAPSYITSARARTQNINRVLESYQIPPALRTRIGETITHAIEAIGAYTTQEGLQGILVVLGFIPWLILIPILAFFLLKDADSFRRSALQLLPRGRLRWRGDEFFQDVNSTLAAYIRAQLIACVLIGTICTLGFVLLGVRYALVLGLIAGFFEFIPLVGPLVVALLAVLVASFYSANQIIGVLIFLGVLRIIHDYVTYPRIIGSGIHLHPLAVILAILAGAELAGVAGIFLAIPVIAILTVTYRHWLEHRGSSGIVADLLKPVEQAVTAPTSAEAQNGAPAALPPAPAKAFDDPHATTPPASRAEATS